MTARKSHQLDFCRNAQVGKRKRRTLLAHLMSLTYLSWNPKSLRHAVFLSVFPINPPQKNNPFLDNNSVETSAIPAFAGTRKWESKEDGLRASDRFNIFFLKTQVVARMRFSPNLSISPIPNPLQKIPFSCTTARKTSSTNFRGPCN